MNPAPSPIYQRLLRGATAAFLLALAIPIHADPAVTKLTGDFDKEVSTKIAPDYDKAMTALEAKYEDELKQSLARATKSGNFDLAVPLQKEIDLVERGAAIPDNDTGAPPDLAKLRVSFRAASKKAMVARDSKLAPIVAKYDRSLAEIQAALTKAGKLEEASSVKTQRDALPAKLGGTAAAAPDGPVTGRVSRVHLTKEVPPANPDGWIVLYEAGRLFGCTPDMELIRNQTIGEQDGNLRVDRTQLRFDVQAGDLEIRLTAKKVSGQNLSVGCREKNDSQSLASWFNGGNNFGVGRFVAGKWKDLRATTEGPMKSGFFELRISVHGTSIQTFVDGQKQFDFENNEVMEPGKIGILALGGVSLFRKIEVKVVK